VEGTPRNTGLGNIWGQPGKVFKRTAIKKADIVGTLRKNRGGVVERKKKKLRKKSLLGDVCQVSKGKNGAGLLAPNQTQQAG